LDAAGSLRVANLYTEWAPILIPLFPASILDAMTAAELDLADLADPEEAPVRRLLKLVLLMAIRDRAELVRFQQHDRSFRMFEKVEGAFLEMVPPPRHLAQRIINLLRVIAQLDHVRGPRPQRGFGHVRLGDYIAHLFLAVRADSFGETADLSLLFSPDMPAEANRELEAYRRPRFEEVGEIRLEFIEGIDEKREPDDRDYFLRS
jgi:type II secretory ATPase GspE/PulE/Tfp pilus assembly ATPase PilB-like protein